MSIVPFVIDGNNLLHALSGAGADPGRAGLCRMLGEFAEAGAGRVRVVFDGREPRGPLAEKAEDARIEVAFSRARSADDVITDFIAADTAPRRLAVVSTDHAIRQAAHKRRCRIVTSENFAALLLRELRRLRQPGPTEPPEKGAGLTPRQTRQWLKELGLDEPEEP